MRIIKAGRDPALGENHVSTCGRCRTEFEWNTNEAQRQSDQRNGYYYVVACPLCGSDVTKELGTGAR